MSGASSSNSPSTNASPAQAAWNQPRSTSTPKDRPCPFCQQPFTSSSLGRHLDLYIKEKNPKPPDGVHNVDRIREMRGKITRRHARGLSSTVASGGPPSSANPAASQSSKSSTSKSDRFDTKSHRAPQPDADENKIADTPHRTHFNRLNWQATGVINDIPPRSNSLDTRDNVHSNPSSLPLEVSGHHQQQHQPQQPPYDSNQVQANNTVAESALKDVLRSIQFATMRLQRPQPFDHDLYTLNFPAMCLRVQPPPSGLFSTTPYSNGNTWPLDIPSQPQYEGVKHIIRNRIKTYYSVFPPDHLRFAATRAELESGIAKTIESQAESYFQHLHSMYLQWQALQEPERRHIWQLEIMRAYVNSIQDHQTTKRRLEESDDKAETLKKQLENAYNKNNNNNTSRSNSSTSNNNPSIPVSVVRDLVEHSTNLHDWDYEALIQRYKSVAQDSWDNRLESAVWYGTAQDPWFASSLTPMNQPNNAPQSFRGSARNVSGLPKSTNAVSGTPAAAGQEYPSHPGAPNFRNTGDVEMTDSTQRSTIAAFHRSTG